MLVAGRTGPERQVQPLERLLGLAVILSVGTQGRFQAAGRQGRLDAAVHGMADGHGQQSVGQAEPVVEIAAQGLGLRGPAGQVPMVQQRRDAWATGSAASARRRQSAS